MPYLPDIPPTSSSFHGIRAEQIMTRNVRYISKDSTYAEVQDLMLEMPRLKAFPVTEDKSKQLKSVFGATTIGGATHVKKFYGNDPSRSKNMR